MRAPALARLAAAALLCAAAAAPASAGPWWLLGFGADTPEEKVKKEQVLDRAQAEFKELREDVAKDYPQNPNFASVVDRTEIYFTKHADERLKQDEYSSREIDALSHVVKRVMMPGMRRVFRVLTDAKLTHEERDQRLGAERLRMNSDMTALTGRGDRRGDHARDHADANLRSEIIDLGMEAARFAVKASKPEVPDGGGGGSGGGGSGGGGSDPNDIGDAVVGGGTDGLIEKGGLDLQAGRYGEAHAMAQRALELRPGDRGALAILHSAEGRGGASGAAAGSAASVLKPGAAVPSGAPPSTLASFPDAGAAGEAAQKAARGALSLGDVTAARAHLDKALALDPRNPALLNLRAAASARAGRWEEAHADAAAALAIAPGNRSLLSTLAFAQNRTGRWREALATAESMIAADPRSAWAYANRAHAYAGLGDRDAMLSDINRAAALDPRFQEAAAAAAALQLPSTADVMFLFPGEAGEGAPAASGAPPAGRARSFGVVAGAAVAGGLLLALGLLSTVLAPLKNTVVSAFTRVRRTGPTTAPLGEAEPASEAGNAGLIRGQYEISRQIGAGGMGMVYEGTDRSLGRRVAIKKMREELRVNARERDRFVIEAKTVASLHHPNIVDIYAIAEEGEDVYLVFEYVDGRTVHELVQLSGRLDPAEAIRVTRAMGEALTYAHSRGVIHRDMKPSNVMLTKTGEVKVMDFGIARMAKDAATRSSMTNTVAGTPPYMAPEQEQGVVRKESDVYSLAICAYEMLTGKPPFIGLGAGMLMNKINMSYIPPSRAIAGLPEALDGVFLKAFQADPERRCRTPQDFVTALEAAAGRARSGTGSA